MLALFVLTVAILAWLFFAAWMQSWLGGPLWVWLLVTGAVAGLLVYMKIKRVGAD